MHWKEVKESNMNPSLTYHSIIYLERHDINKNKPQLEHGTSQIRRSVDMVLFFLL